MGVSPSPLHYGPTANYGSIIIPCTVFAVSGTIRISRISFIARSFWEKEVLAHLRSGLTFQSYRLMYLMNGYSVVKVRKWVISPSHLSNGTEKSKSGKTFFEFVKNFFFLISKCSSWNIQFSCHFHIAYGFFLIEKH